jgi:cyclic nucleotide-binding protein
MAKKAKTAPFDPKVFLATVNGGRSISKYRMNQKVFSQGTPADAVFYILKGKVKVTVVSEQGKEAVVAVLGPDEFCGMPDGTAGALGDRSGHDRVRDHAAGESDHDPRPP